MTIPIQVLLTKTCALMGLDQSKFFCNGVEAVTSQVLLPDREILKSPISLKTPNRNKKVCDENFALFETNILPKKFHATNCDTMRLFKNKNFPIEIKYLTALYSVYVAHSNLRMIIPN